jgi:error-prone DNA polymerase
VYTELVAASNFSFLRGASHPGELVHQAAALGLTGIGITDRNSFAGVVRGHVAAREVAEARPDFRYVVGVRLVFSDQTPDIIAYPTDRAAYGRLCALLTIGNRRAVKGDCILRFTDLAAHADGQLFIIIGDREPFSSDEYVIRKLNEIAPGRVWLGATCQFRGVDARRLDALADLARKTGVPMLATNDVLYHHHDRRPLQDIVTCIREHVTIREAGFRLVSWSYAPTNTPRSLSQMLGQPVPYCACRAATRCRSVLEVAPTKLRVTGPSAMSKRRRPSGETT